MRAFLKKNIQHVLLFALVCSSLMTAISGSHDALKVSLHNAESLVAEQEQESSKENSDKNKAGKQDDTKKVKHLLKKLALATVLGSVVFYGASRWKHHSTDTNAQTRIVDKQDDHLTSSPPHNDKASKQHTHSPPRPTVLSGDWEKILTQEFGKVIPTTGVPFAKKDFVQNLVGKTEEELLKSIKDVIQADVRPHTFEHFQAFKYKHPTRFGAVRRQLLEKRVFSPHGEFTLHTIQHLRTLTKDGKPFEQPGFLKVIEADKFPIENLQARHDLKGATIQIASTNAAIEGAVVNNKAGALKWLLGAMAHGTQGEQASISAGCAALDRYYYQPAVNLLGKVIGFIDNLPDAIKPEARIKTWIQQQGSMSDEALVDLVKNIQVGVHTDVEVTSTSVDGGQTAVSVVPGHTIHQVFTFALRWRHDTFGNDLHNPVYQKVAQAILDAAYEGTLRAAYLAGSQKVVLTLVGGGVFKNPWKWIANAIEKNQNFIRQKNLQVYVAYWPSKNEKNNTILKERMQK